MKKMKEIMDLPLISIDGAIELGRIKDILIDPDSGKVKYLLIMDREWYLGAKLVSFDNLFSIGSDAVTIRDQKDYKQFSEVEDAIELAKRGIDINDARVYTEEGQYIGIMEEFYIGLKDGSISKCSLDGVSGLQIIENPNIIAFGSKILVLGGFDDRNLKPIKTDNGTKADGIKADEPKENQGKNEKARDNQGEDKGVKSSLKLFEEKQRQFLIGRKGIKTILDDSGDILLEEGQVLTEEILERVHDKNKIMELTINTR